jgi:glycogen operon protein
MAMPLFDTAASTTDASTALPLGVSVPRPGVARAGLAGIGKGPAAQANVACYAPGVRNLEIVYKAPGGDWRVQALPNVSQDVHYGTVDNLPYGSRYGFREAAAGQSLPVAVPAGGIDDDRGQPLLLDPYGRAVDQSDGFLTSVRMAGDFDWGADARLKLPWRDTIVYEAHVRGQSMLHPDVPGELRGTYAGWRILPSWSTSKALASRPSSCCPCTSTWMSRTCRTWA